MFILVYLLLAFAAFGQVQSGSININGTLTVNGTATLTSITPGYGVSITGSQVDVDSAVIASRANLQSGASVYLASASGSGTTYTGSLTPALTAYTTGMVLPWKPDVNGSGGATTINVNGLGAKSIKQADGTTDPTSTSIVAGQLYFLWYDGTNFRLFSGGGGSSTSTKNLYYAPAAKTINGVGASVYQCSANCGVPTAKTSGSVVTASLHVTGSSMAAFDQFVLPTGYSDNQITVEVIARTATDNNAAHSATITFTSAAVTTGEDITNPTLGNSTALTFNPHSTAGGYVRLTGTFTPSSWTAGKTALWKATFNQGTVTSDLEILSVRFYATF